MSKVTLPLTRDHLYTSLNNIRVTCLYKELCAQGDKPIFTIRTHKEGLISIKNLFVDLTVDDPTEVTFANEVFGEVGYWLKSRENPTLKPHLEEWRLEADVIRKSKAFKAIVDEVVTNGKSALSASKYLIEEPWKSKSGTPETKAKRGRPSNKQITSEKARANTYVPDSLADFISEQQQQKQEKKLN